MNGETTTLDKHKEKIKKLLELSLSDNENEANIALRQALALMNKHNITKDEVYGQKMVSEQFTVPYRRVPAWYLQLHATMCSVSGCFMVYANGNPYTGELARISITGRERDVENSIYLITFLSRELEKHTHAYQAQIAGTPAQNHRVKFSQSFKMGFIHKISERMHETQRQFFSSQGAGNAIVCVDRQARTSDARTFYETTANTKTRAVKSQTRTVLSAAEAGARAAEELAINSALHRQKEVKSISKN